MLKVAGGLISGGGNGTGTVTQVDTGTGLTGGPITTSGTISLANTTVTAGTYGNSTAVAQLAIDAQGRITSASNVSISLTAGGNTTEIQYNNGGVLAGLSTFTTDGTNVVLSANSATDAFRITQLGAGNAFVVEDETNPDSTPFQINASGQVSIGTTAAAGRLNIYHPTTATVNLSGDSATAINSTRYSSDTTTTNIQMRKARGTLASPTAVNSGDGTGILIYNAYGGTNFRQIATVAGTVETYTSDTNISGLLTFSTNSGGTAVTEKMRITAAGDVGIGTSSPAQKLTVSGALLTTGITTVAQISAASFDFNSSANAARILAWGATSVVGNIQFWTGDGAGGANQRVTIVGDGNVGIGTASPSVRLHVQNTTAATNTVTDVLRLDSQSSGTPANGIGVGMEFAVETSVGNTEVGALIEAIVTDVTAASEDFDLLFSTMAAGATAAERVRITSTGNVGIGTTTPTQALAVNGAVGYNAPVTVTDATHTVADTTNWLIANRAGTVTLTLPAAASYTGRILTVKNVQAQTVVSNASNVVPIGSTTAGTAILAATAGKFATMVSNGTNWVIMQAN